MRIIFVLTYPIHHAIPSLAEWLDWRTRDRLMPGIVRELGCEAELWGVGPEPFAGPSVLAETAPYPIRIFPPDDPRVRTRAQTSAALNAASDGTKRITSSGEEPRARA